MARIRDEQLLSAFGKRLRKLRLERNMTQVQLADIVNINRSQVIDIEKGSINPTISTLNALAEGLDLSLSRLVDLGAQET